MAELVESAVPTGSRPDETINSTFKNMVIRILLNQFSKK